MGDKAVASVRSSQAFDERSVQKATLIDVCAWLVVNTTRMEQIQYNMLQLQNLANVWRRNAFAHVLDQSSQNGNLEDVRARLLQNIRVFKEDLLQDVKNVVPESTSLANM